MAETRTVQMYTKKAVDKGKGISRADYRAIKHMNKIELTHYLHRIYMRGFEDGKASVAEQSPVMSGTEE